MGLAISAQAANPDRAASLVPVALIPQIIFSGVVVNLADFWIGRLLSYLMVTKWTYRALGAIADVDRIPIPKQAIAGLPPDLAPQLTASNQALLFDAAHRTYALLPATEAEFTRGPAVYLGILVLFIALSLALVFGFQRRKDWVR